jgi:hypothetical protein
MESNPSNTVGSGNELEIGVYIICLEGIALRSSSVVSRSLVLEVLQYFPHNESSTITLGNLFLYNELFTVLSYKSVSLLVGRTTRNNIHIMTIITHIAIIILIIELYFIIWNDILFIIVLWYVFIISFSYRNMSTSLGFSEIDTIYDTIPKRADNRITSKRKESSRVESMLKELNDPTEDLGEFKPPAKPISTTIDKNDYNDSHDTVVEGYNNMDSTSIDNYYQQYVPSLSSTPTPILNDNKVLLDKLNFMIHLLEEDKDTKKGSVTEEVVLYSFLGVFIIFVVDSFVKVGKYVR